MLISKLKADIITALVFEENRERQLRGEEKRVKWSERETKEERVRRRESKREMRRGGR